MENEQKIEETNLEWNLVGILKMIITFKCFCILESKRVTRQDENEI